jgi:hypothetical protein
MGTDSYDTIELVLEKTLVQTFLKKKMRVQQEIY